MRADGAGFFEGNALRRVSQSRRLPVRLPRVPRAIGDFLILDAIRESGGTAIAVSDEELLEAVAEIGALEGVFCAPEGAACLPALRKLLADGAVKPDERIVLFNTGAGVKYLERFS